MIHRNVQNFLVPCQKREREHEKLHSIQQTGPHEQQDSHELQDRNMSHTNCMGNTEREVFAGSLEQSRDRIMKRWGRPRAMQDLSVRCETQPSSLIAVRMTLRSR